MNIQIRYSFVKCFLKFGKTLKWIDFAFLNVEKWNNINGESMDWKIFFKIFVHIFFCVPELN